MSNEFADNGEYDEEYGSDYEGDAYDLEYEYYPYYDEEDYGHYNGE